MKFIVQFFLVPCIMLLNANSNPYTYAIRDCNDSAVSVLIKNSTERNAGDAINTKSISSCSKQNFKLEIAEIEEDKLFSFRVYLKGVHFFTTLFADQTPGHFFGYIHTSEPLAKSHSELSSNISFVTFQVFRI